MSSPRLRAGLVGAGYISEYHVAAIRRLGNVELVGVSDLDETKANALASRFGLAVYGGMEGLVCAGANTIHVLTPPATHAEIAIRALQLGCNVLVEKPMATSAADCDRIAAAAAAAGRAVCVNHSLLYDRFVKQMLRAVAAGRIGDVVAVDYFRSSDYPPYMGGPLPPQYRDGGYPFRDLGIHALYLMSAFLGDIRRVDGCFWQKGGDGNLAFDEWRATIHCRRGMGHVQISWNVRPLQHLLLVQGTRGVLKADLFGMWVTERRNTPLPKAVERGYHGVSEGRQIISQVLGNSVRFARKKILPYHGLQMLVDAFYDSLRTNQPMPATPAGARPIVDWVERVARQADAAKVQLQARFRGQPTATTLVTGANGFLGRALVNRLLDRGGRLRVMVRREPPAEWFCDSRLEIIVGDLGDPEAVERAVAGCRLVYHVGGAMKGAPHDFFRGSVAGTENIVACSLKHGVIRLVHVSSLSVLHSRAAQRGRPVTEEWPLEPYADKRGLYSKTKLAAEKLVQDAVRDHGLNAVILRPGRIIGPGSRLVTPDVGLQLGNRIIVLGSGELALPLVYIDDVVDAIVAAGHAEVSAGAIFNLVDPEAMTQNQILQYHRAKVEPLIRIWHVPLSIVLCMAFAADLVRRALGRPGAMLYRLKSALSPIQFDCGRAKQSLGWVPRIGVRAGLTNCGVQATIPAEADRLAKTATQAS